jgi:uncharacterized membrane protein
MGMSAWLKYTLTFAAVFAFRLLPFRAPNVEPVLAAVMPMSKRYGALAGTLFGVLSIVLYDAVTSGWGSWTVITAFSYGALGVASYYYFRNREASTGNFVRFSIVGILFYDAVTGPIAITLGGHSFSAALAGQIPFTVLHLLGGVAFAALVSPALYRWFSTSESFAKAPVRAEPLGH